jgi:L-arabinose isomerase
MLTNKVKVGFFSIGLETYWGQFPGLYKRLEGYSNNIASRLQEQNANVIYAGLVDTVEKAREAADLFKKEDVSLIFLYVSTYALSSTVLPVVQKANVPVIILNLQPSKSIDYNWFNNLPDITVKTSEWLAYCQACPVPEIANVFNRARIKFHQITGTLDDAESWAEINEWVEAAKVAKVMRENRLGVLGHYYCGMLDVYSDLTQQSVYFGSHIELLEMCHLKSLRDKVTDTEIEIKIKQIYNEFDVSNECLPAEIKRAAKTAVALDKMVAEKKLGSLAYYYEGESGNDYQDIITSVIAGNSLLTAHNVPVAGEMEIKNIQAMKIMDAFGAGGSFSEFNGIDFDDNIILMGHDGPGHLAIAQGKPKLEPLRVYHGKPGNGLSVEMKVKHGDTTLLAVVQTFDGKLKMITAQGKSVPGPILEVGNTMSRYRFPVNVKQFINDWCSHGPSHHCAIGVGHIASKINKLGYILNMDVTEVC